MFQFILIVCLILNVSFADPERSGQYLKYDRTIVNCAKYKREANQHSCILAPYTMEGPFFLGDDVERSDITNGQKGVPLTFNLKVTDSRDCSPLSGLYVHVWSANATGFYSGVNNYGGMGGNQGPPKGPEGFGSLDPNEGAPGMGGMGGGRGGPGGRRGPGGPGGRGGDHQPGRPTPINDDRSLRGYQISDAEGSVSFETIIPGWYAGRCQHLHVEVYRDVKVENVTFVGQVFFPESIIPELQKISPYTENINPIVPHAEDDLYSQRQGELMELTLNKKDNGYEASIILGINPEYSISTDGIQVSNDLP